MNDTTANDATQRPPLPDHLSADPRSPHHVAAVFEHDIGIRFNDTFASSTFARSCPSMNATSPAPSSWRSGTSGLTSGLAACESATTRGPSSVEIAASAPSQPSGRKCSRAVRW